MRAALFVVTAVLVGAAAPAAAGASVPAAAGGSVPGFGPARTLEPPSSSPGERLATAVSDSGRTVVAYEAGTAGTRPRVVVRRGSLTAPLGRRERMTASDAPSVAVAATRTAVVLQRRPHRERFVQVRVAAGSGRFGAPQTLVRTRSSVGTPVIVAFGRDRFVALWRQGDPRTGQHPIRYAASTSAGRFGPSRVLVGDSGPNGDVSAARLRDGSVLAAWGTPLVRQPVRNQQLQSARLTPGASAWAVGPGGVAAAGPFAETVGIGVAAGPGGAGVTWTEEGAFPELLRTAVGGGPPETVFALIDSQDLGSRYATGPRLAFPAVGAPFAAWAVVDATGGESEVTTGGTAFAAARSADGSYLAPQALSPPAETATAADAAATRSLAVVTWADGRFPDYELHYAVRDAAGTFGPERTLTPAARRPVTLAASTAGVLAVWLDRSTVARRLDPDAGNGLKLAVLTEGAAGR